MPAKLTRAQWGALCAAVALAEVEWEQDPRRVATLNRAWERLMGWSPTITS
jgi:hypothetical protein